VWSQAGRSLTLKKENRYESKITSKQFQRLAAQIVSTAQASARPHARLQHVDL
jgi:hypothetical protein